MIADQRRYYGPIARSKDQLEAESVKRAICKSIGNRGTGYLTNEESDKVLLEMVSKLAKSILVKVY